MEACVGIGPKEDTPREEAGYSDVVTVAHPLCVIMQGLAQKNDSIAPNLPGLWISETVLLFGYGINVISDSAVYISVAKENVVRICGPCPQLKIKRGSGCICQCETE